MALIKCPECGGSFSDKAECCPHCGFPTDEILSNTNVKEKPISKTPRIISPSRNKNHILLIICLIPFLLLLVWGGFSFFNILINKNTDNTNVPLYRTEKKVWRPGNSYYLYGYEDGSGKTRIKCQFLEAEEFTNGRAIVQKKDSSWAVINKNCKALFTTNYTLLGEENGLFAVRNDEGKYGFIDSNNNIVIPFKLSDPPTKDAEEHYWQNGYCRIGWDKLINKQGNIVYPLDLEILGVDGKYGYNTVTVRRSDGRLSIMSINQRLLLPWGNYKDIYFLNGKSFLDSNWSLFAVEFSDNSFHIYNINGEFEDTNSSYSSLDEIIDKGYEVRYHCSPFSDSIQDDKSYSTFEENGKWGVLNSNGNIIVKAWSKKPVRFVGANINKSYAVVNNGLSNAGYDYIIDLEKDNSQVFPFDYSDINLPDKYGLAKLGDSNRKAIVNCKNGNVIVTMGKEETISSFVNGKAELVHMSKDKKHITKESIDTLGNRRLIGTNVDVLGSIDWLKDEDNRRERQEGIMRDNANNAMRDMLRSNGVLGY